MSHKNTRKESKLGVFLGKQKILLENWMYRKSGRKLILNDRLKSTKLYLTQWQKFYQINAFMTYSIFLANILLLYVCMKLFPFQLLYKKSYWMAVWIRWRIVWLAIELNIFLFAILMFHHYFLWGFEPYSIFKLVFDWKLYSWQRGIVFIHEYYLYVGLVCGCNSIFHRIIFFFGCIRRISIQLKKMCLMKNEPEMKNEMCTRMLER